MSWRVCCLIGLTCAILAGPASCDAQEEAESKSQQLLVVVGASGTPEYGEQFRAWCERWRAAAEGAKLEFRTIGIDEQPGASASDPSTGVPGDLEMLQRTISEWGSVETTEPLWIVMIGHGAFDQRSATFNLRGRDISASGLAEICKDCKRPLAVVCCFSCSSPFINAMSGQNRVVISATKDPNQIQYSRFGDAMSLAMAGLEADTDRDGQTSLLEAWLFASRRTAEFYTQEGRLATEHSLLDDNGDAQGSRAELFEGLEPKKNLKEPEKVDRSLAVRWHLVRSADELRLTADQRQQRDELEQKLAELRNRRSEMAEPEYLDRLQEILVPLAKIIMSDRSSCRTNGASIEQTQPTADADEKSQEKSEGQVSDSPSAEQ